MNSMVKCARVVLLVLLVALPGAAAAGCISSECGESKVDWLYSLDEALSRAQSDERLVMIDFYADWCPPCKKMDCETYTDEGLGAFINENFAPLKVNVDKSNVDGPYGISSIPQVVFVLPEGAEFDRALRIVGYLPTGSFQSRLQAVLDSWNSGIH